MAYSSEYEINTDDIENADQMGPEQYSQDGELLSTQDGNNPMAWGYAVGSIGAEDKTATTALDIAETADPTGLVGKGRKLYNLAKGLFGGGSKSDSDRQAKVTKFFAETFPTMNPSATAIVLKMNSLGGAFAMANLAAAQTKSYNWMANIYAYYVRYNNGIAAAQGYRNGVAQDLKQMSWTERAGGLDQALEAYGEMTGRWATAVERMKAGEVDPISWSTYRNVGGKYFVDKWNGTAFVEEEVPAAEKDRRQQLVGGVAAAGGSAGDAAAATAQTVPPAGSGGEGGGGSQGGSFGKAPLISPKMIMFGLIGLGVVGIGTVAMVIIRKKRKAQEPKGV
jgi:hypothetical protein